MNTREQAKLLVKESFGANGSIDFRRVEAVCDYVEKDVQTQRKIPLLRAYMNMLKPILKKEEALVEVSGSISDEAFEEIKKFVISETGRSDLRFQKLENKKLLGGIRVTCGDNIWESTALSALERLRP